MEAPKTETPWYCNVERTVGKTGRDFIFKYGYN
jgi:hypothetical protein